MTIIEMLTDVLSPVATAVGGWMIGRRKKKAEAATTELENVEKAIAIWRKLASDLEVKCDELLAEIAKLQMQNMRLFQENGELKNKLVSLEHRLNQISNK